jgi:hypothetical protein
MINENSLQRKYFDIEIENKKVNDLLRESLYYRGTSNEKNLDENCFSNIYTEVKTETEEAFSQYGNCFIETSTKIKGTLGFKDSGFSVTKAEYWVISMETPEGILPISLNVSVEHIRNLVERGLVEKWVKYHETDKLSTGDISRGYLVPFIRIVEYYLMRTSEYGMEGFLKDYYEYRNSLKPTDEYKQKRLKEISDEKRKNR